MTLDEVMAYLYKHEINTRVECFWDGGFNVFLGDTMNGFRYVENFDVADLKHAADKLMDAAKKFYPGCTWQ